MSKSKNSDLATVPPQVPTTAAQPESLPQSTALPAVDERLGKYLPGGAAGSIILRTNLDVQSATGRSLLTRLLTDPPAERKSPKDCEVTIIGYLVTEGEATDEKTGEVRPWPRTALLLSNETHVTYGGTVMLRSVLLLDSICPPSAWQAGLRVRVHGQRSRFGGTMHRLELLNEGKTGKVD